MERIQLKNIRKKKRRRRIFWFIIFPILLIAGSATAYGAFLYNKAENAVSKSFKQIDGREKSDKRTAKVDPHTDNISILFIGVDDSKSRNYGEATRSDALILATLNEKEKSVKLVSIPRDSYVYIPEKDVYSKINAAHAWGGPKATIDTVENLMDVPVDYYVRFNFYAFMDIVDAVGGIKVNVPYAMSEKDSEDHHNAINLQPGEQVLNGEQALAFARTRKQDSDIQRGGRQQEVMKAVLAKAASAGSISKYGDLIEAVGDNMKTNMSFDDMKSLISYGTSGHLNIESLSLKGSDDMSTGVYYYKLDDQSVEEVKAALKQHLGLDKQLTQNSGNSDSNNVSDSETEAAASSGN